MRSAAAPLIALLLASTLALTLALGGCSELQFEKDRSSGSSGDGTVGNVLVSIAISSGVGYKITRIEITVARAGGAVDTYSPKITYPFSTDVVVDPGDFVRAEADVSTGTTIMTMQLRDNPAVVTPAFTYDTATCPPASSCTPLSVENQF